MPLSDEERAILEQMEQELRRDDPKFANTMSAAHREHPAPHLPKQWVPRRVAAGIIMVVVGQIIMLGGISLPHLWMTIVVGVIGFAIMLGGVLYALARQPASSNNFSRRPRGSGNGGGESFMERQERLWDENHRR